MTAHETCPDCDGVGEVQRNVDNPRIRAQLVLCLKCHGEGEWCPDCAKPASQCECTEQTE